MTTDVREPEAAPAPAPVAERLIVAAPGPEGPARFFRDHPALYRLAVTAAAGTAISAAMRAARARTLPRRLAFTLLAIMTAGQAFGLLGLRRASAQPCCDDQPTP